MLRYVVIAFFAMLFGVASAQERAVRVIGSAAPSPGQAAINARQLAIDDALLQAVKQGIGVFITSETLVQNFELVNDQILKKSSGFARIDKINKEGPTPSGSYAVDATVIVSSQRILTKIRDLIQGINDPRFGVFIAETLDNNPLTASSAGTAVSKALIEFGFRVIDQHTLETQIKREELIASQDNPAALASLGRRLNLEFIVTGTARAKRVSNTGVTAGTGVISTQGILELRMIETSTGQVVWTDEVVAADYAFDLDVSVSNTMRRIAGIFTELKSGFMDQLRTVVNGSSTIKYILKISNLKSFSALNTLIQKLKTQNGVKGVIARDYDPNGTVVEVEYAGPIDGIAVLIEHLGLTITGITGREIRAKAP